MGSWEWEYGRMGLCPETPFDDDGEYHRQYSFQHQERAASVTQVDSFLIIIICKLQEGLVPMWYEAVASQPVPRW